jgi:hypothetical protein
VNDKPWVYHYHAESYKQNGAVQHRDGIICSSKKIDSLEAYRETRENIRKSFDDKPLAITLKSLSFLHGPTEGAKA